MNIHCFSHAEFENPGHISAWVSTRNAKLHCTQLFSGELAPLNLDADLLVILGGPMSVHDEKKYPWLKQEKQAIESAIKSGIRVLGICLGAQLIAQVLGAKVKKNSQMEVGWHWMKSETPRLLGRSAFPDEFEAFQWHEDTFDIPYRATHTFSSLACENQGFVYGTQIIALQFHPEIDRQGIESLIANEYRFLSPSPFIQSLETIQNRNLNIECNKKRLFSLLDHWMAAQKSTSRMLALDQL